MRVRDSSRRIESFCGAQLRRSRRDMRDCRDVFRRNA